MKYLFISPEDEIHSSIFNFVTKNIPVDLNDSEEVFNCENETFHFTKEETGKEIVNFVSQNCNEDIRINVSNEASATIYLAGGEIVIELFDKTFPY